MAFLSLYSSNAFNCLMRKQLAAVLLEGCYKCLLSKALPQLHLHRQPPNLNHAAGTCCGNSLLPTMAATAFSIFITAAPPQISTLNQVYYRVIH